MEILLDKSLESLKAKYADYFWRLPFETHYLIFDQQWGSTALGFVGAMGCSAITKAPTLVVYGYKVKDNYIVADVFFGGTYAYSCNLENEAFKTDLLGHCLKNTEKAKQAYQSFEDDDIKLMAEIYFEEKRKRIEEEKGKEEE